MNVDEVVANLKLNMVLLEQGMPDVGSHPQRVRDRVRDSLRDLAGRIAEEGIDAEDGPDVPAGPGFVCLPIEAHDRLRREVEELEETRTALRQADDHHDAAMAKVQALADQVRRLEAQRHEWSAVDPAWFPIKPEPGREGDRIEPFTMGPMHVTPRIMADPVVHNHLRDLQGEIDGLKDRLDKQEILAANLENGGERHEADLRTIGDRLDESCAQHRALNARLAALEQGGASPDGTFAEIMARGDQLLEALDDIKARGHHLFGRIEATCRTLEEIQRRLTRCEDTHNVTDAAYGNLSDQVKAFAARLNRLEAQMRPMDVMQPTDAARSPMHAQVRREIAEARDRIAAQAKTIDPAATPFTNSPA